MLIVRADPLLAGLHRDPRFQALLARLNLADDGPANLDSPFGRAPQLATTSNQATPHGGTSSN
jgi:hypothetical protein